MTASGDAGPNQRQADATNESPKGAADGQPNAPPPVITADMLEPPAAADPRADFERGMPVAPRLTLLLIVINVAVFIWEVATEALESPEAITAAGAVVRERVLQGEIWRLATAPFLHGGLEHLIGNVVALYVLGMICEHALGPSRTGLLYGVAALGGSLASALVNVGPGVGASGAVFGLMGGAIVFFRRHGRRFIVRDNRIATVLVAWAVYSVVIGLLTPFVDNAAHVGGLLFGAVVTTRLRPRILDRLAHVAEGGQDRKPKG